jgi:hypothetical protein
LTFEYLALNHPNGLGDAKLLFTVVFGEILVVVRGLNIFLIVGGARRHMLFGRFIYPDKAEAVIGRPSSLPRLLPWQIFEKSLLAVVLVELGLGGNGYLTMLDGVRLRVFLYVVCMAWIAVRLTFIEPIRMDPRVVWFTVFFASVTAFGAGLGYVSGNPLSAIIAELKPLFYFPMLLFFAVAIRSGFDLSLVAGILVACGTAVAVFYLLTLSAAAVGFVDYVELFRFLRQSDEFIFRHNPNGPFIGFFYKGTFYICVAAIFLLFDHFRKAWLFAIVPVVAVAMTLTRGLGGALIASILFGMALNQNWRRAPVLLGHAVLLAAVLFLAMRSETALLMASGDLYSGERIETPAATPVAASPPTVQVPATQEPPLTAPPRTEKRGLTAEQIRTNYPQETARPGDAERVEDIKFVLQHTSALSAVFGHGLGSPVSGKNRIEMTYVEVFHKQGILGLVVWLCLFAYSFAAYLKIPAQAKQFGVAFLISSFFVAAATASNTFLTGSIGMAVVFIAVVSLSVLSKEPNGC